MKDLSRKHISILLTLGLILAFLVMPLALAGDPDDQCDYIPPPAFTWEGELNPNEFDTWEVIVEALGSPFTVWQFLKNPDPNSLIEGVAAELSFDGTLLAYRYWKGTEAYRYVLDSEQQKYVLEPLTREEYQSCLKCHDDKAKLKAESI